MYGTPGPTSRASLGRHASSDLAPASELSEHGLLSEDEVIAPRLRDDGTLAPREDVTAPPPRSSWVGVAFAGALSTILVLWVAATVFAVIALVLWRAA